MSIDRATPIIRVAGYLRTGPDDPRFATYLSLESQEAAVRAYVEEQGWALTRVYTDEEATPWDDRSGFDALLAAAVDPDTVPFEVVVVASLDRLDRDWALPNWRRIEEAWLSLASAEFGDDSSLAAFRADLDGLAWEQMYRVILQAHAHTTAAGEGER